MNSSPPKVYILNFWAEGVNLDALQQYLHDSVDVIAYWNYIPLVYCIKSRLTATDLSAKLAPFFPHHFMIAEINEWNTDGKMSAAAWDWFYLAHHDKVRPPAPVAGLGGFLTGGFGSPFDPPPGLLTPPRKKS
jgi:hypothetical protein